MKKDTNASEKSKILMRTYITSILSLMLCVTMLLGTTYAWFTSEVTTSGNEIYVGTLKVDMLDENNESLADATGLFGSGSFKWEPGATKIETIKIVNLGDLAFDYGLYLSPLNSEVGDLLTAGKFIDVYITTNDAPASTAEELKNNWIRVGNLADVAQNGYMLVNGSWTPNTPAVVAEDPAALATVKIALHLPGNVSDEKIMGAKITNLGVKLLASQKPFEQDDIKGDHDSEAAVVVNVSNETELAAAFNAGQRVNLTADIKITENTTLTVPTGKQVVINMNGKNITSTSSGTGVNREMFLVKGNLIIKGQKAEATTVAEGETAQDPYMSAISYTHNSANNMGWNNMTTIFDVTDGGLLQLEDVKVVNNGGTDMNFVAHLNNWGTASLYTEGCHLEAGYCAVRVFNSGPDMNNFVAKNTTLKGKHAFWVHNYTAADFGEKYDAEAVDARLNINIYNGQNTISGNVIYGFTGTEYHVTSGDAFADTLEKGVDKIVLQKDISILYAPELKAGVKTILDLNGHKITGPNNLIENNGELTIEGEGEIAVTFNGTVDNSKAVNAITNRGVLIVNDGKISNTGVGDQIGYAIDNYSGSTLIVNGGEITASGSTYYDAIRLFCGSEETVVTVNGGKISTIWAQNPTADKATPVYGTVSVNGGEVGKVYFENYTTVKVLDGVTTVVEGYNAGKETNTTFTKEDNYTVYSFVH